jgi:hypothetical protein
MTDAASAADKGAKAKPGKGRSAMKGRVRHVVCFQYKEGTSKGKIAEINQAFRALKGKIPGVVGFEMGENNSPEGLNKGFSHCYIVTFESAAARETYLPHEEHQNFVALLKPHLEDVFVIDFTL